MKEKKNSFSLIRKFVPYYKKYKWTLFLDLLCASLTTVCELVLPMIVREITGAATENIAAAITAPAVDYTIDTEVKHCPAGQQWSVCTP